MSLALNRLIRSFLFNLSPTDSLTYAAVALAILIVTGIASFLPAWRASRVDPVVTLRVD